MGDVPFVGFAQATLAALPSLQAGDLIRCPTCGEEHVARPSDGNATVRVLFYKCPQKAGVFLAGIAGRNVVGVEPDAGSHRPEATAPLCDLCWEMRHPDRSPSRIEDADLETCLRCSQPTLSGIYVLRKDWALPA